MQALCAFIRLHLHAQSREEDQAKERRLDHSRYSPCQQDPQDSLWTREHFYEGREQTDVQNQHSDVRCRILNRDRAYLTTVSYTLALACSFEVSTTVNFILNQLFTYHEQKHLHGWDWVKRALKAQMTSLSALAVTYIIALVFKYGVHVSPYVASTIDIVSAFIYNFIISKRLVFRPATRERSEHVTQPASFRLTSHLLSSTSPGYIEIGEWPLC